jgi:hypothetical protein
MAKPEREILSAVPRRRARASAELPTFEELFSRVDGFLARVVPWLLVGALGYVAAHLVAAALRGLP